MNKRTRLLAWGALGAAGLLTGGFVLQAVVSRPLRSLDAQILQLQVRWNSLQKERQEFLQAEAEVRAHAGRLFAAQAEAAEARLGALLTAQIVRVGLRETDFTRIPVGRRRLPGAEEVGWIIQGEGALPRLLDLLFLLQSEPRLHRVEGLSLTPANEGARTRVRFRYVTLVLTPPPELGAPEAPPELSLDDPGRRRYDAITQRDLFRPFVPEEPRANPAPPAGPPEPSQPNFRVVSLSSWDGQPEVHLFDDREKRVIVRRPGDTLLDGQVAMVDYRPLPLPNKPGLLSFSRLIWRRDTNYWAVESGQSFADRRALAPDELPPALRPTATNSLSP